MPANRIGHARTTAAQLKMIQEVITLVVFAVFSILYFKEDFKWNSLVGFAFILVRVDFVLKNGKEGLPLRWLLAILPEF